MFFFKVKGIKGEIDIKWKESSENIEGITISRKRKKSKKENDERLEQPIQNNTQSCKQRTTRRTKPIYKLIWEKKNSIRLFDVRLEVYWDLRCEFI